MIASAVILVIAVNFSCAALMQFAAISESDHHQFGQWVSLIGLGAAAVFCSYTFIWSL